MRKFKENSTTDGDQIIETSSNKNGLPRSTPQRSTDQEKRVAFQIVNLHVGTATVWLQRTGPTLELACVQEIEALLDRSWYEPTS